MNDNGQPEGKIADGFPAQEAQQSRQHLDALLGGFFAAKEEMNQRRLLKGEPPQAPGIQFREQDPVLVAARAVCAHLHHLTAVLVSLRQALEPRPARGADEELKLKRIVKTAEEDR